MRGTWGDVRIGSLIQGSEETLNDVWKAVEFRNAEQHDYKITPWILLEKVSDGTRAAISPRPKSYMVKFMVPEGTVDPEAQRPRLDKTTIGLENTMSDQAAVDLIVEQLGGVIESWKAKDSEIVMCPPYAELPGSGAEEFRHIEIAHGIDMSGVDPKDIARIVTIHGQDHKEGSRQPRVNARGFSHQHDYHGQSKPFADFY